MVLLEPIKMRAMVMGSWYLEHFKGFEGNVEGHLIGFVLFLVVFGWFLVDLKEILWVV